MPALLAALFGFFCSIAQAFTLDDHVARLSVFAITNHVKQSGLNDWHPMLQLEYRSTWTMGVFVNSHSRTSAYLARRWQWPDRFGKPFVELGGATGYSDHVVRSVRVGWQIHHNLDLIFMPGFGSLHTWQIHEPISVIGIIAKF